MQKSQTVGRHFSYQTIDRLCKVLVALWYEACRDQHRNDSDPLVNEAFDSLRHSALFNLCRQVRDETGEPLNEANNAEARLKAFFSKRANLSALPAAYCETITLAAQNVEALRQAAKLETDRETQKILDIGFYSMKRQLSRLLEVGLLAELPVTSVMVAPNEITLTKVAAVLQERRQVYKSASTDSRFEPWVRADLAQSMGCRLFDGVRAQERHRAEIGIDGLVKYLGRPHPRFRRAIFADAAHGVHEVFEVAQQHAKSIGRAKKGSQLRTRRRNASLISWITVVELLRTGLLKGVGSPETCTAS